MRLAGGEVDRAPDAVTQHLEVALLEPQEVHAGVGELEDVGHQRAGVLILHAHQHAVELGRELVGVVDAAHGESARLDDVYNAGVDLVLRILGLAQEVEREGHPNVVEVEGRDGAFLALAQGEGHLVEVHVVVELALDDVQVFLVEDGHIRGVDAEQRRSSGVEDA